jgi:hypothetical protein
MKQVMYLLSYYFGYETLVSYLMWPCVPSPRYRGFAVTLNDSMELLAQAIPKLECIRKRVQNELWL